MKTLISQTLVTFLILFFTSTLFGQTYTITNTDPEGAGSLSDAIAFANSNNGPDTIHFDIPGTGPFFLSTGLPFWDDQTLIDASTQANYYLGQIIIGTDENDWGSLFVFGDGCEFYGLAADSIALFGGNDFRIGAPGKSNLLRSIYAENSDLGSIQANLIGTNALGTEGMGTPGSGIITVGCDDLLIGGDLPDEGNLISGKLLDGMQLQDPKNFVIKNNKIGTDISGTYAIPNGRHGINGVVHDAVTIGEGLSSGNLISGNMGNGIVTASVTNGDCLIAGNKIGTDITGELPIPNGGKGMWISGGTPVLIKENTVAYHEEEGIYIDDIVRKKRIVDNSLFCNELGGYHIDQVEAIGIDSISSTIIMGFGPENSVIDIYRADLETCLSDPCQGAYFVGTTTTDDNGDWLLADSLISGRYMINTTSSDDLTSMISECMIFDLSTNIYEPGTHLYQLTQNDPNPFTSSTQIQVYLPIREKGTFSVFDMTGRLVYQEERDFDSGWNTLLIDSEQLPENGLYFYNFSTAHFSQSKKLLKQ